MGTLGPPKTKAGRRSLTQHHPGLTLPPWRYCCSPHERGQFPGVLVPVPLAYLLGVGEPDIDELAQAAHRNPCAVGRLSRGYTEMTRHRGGGRLQPSTL